MTTCCLDEFGQHATTVSHFGRFGGKPQAWHPVMDGRMFPDRITTPSHWRRKLRLVTIGGRGDLFHTDVTDGFITWVWMTMLKSWHQYRIETAYPDRMCDWLRKWCDLTGESHDFKGVRGPEATRAAHPSGRGQLFAAYLDELGKTVPPGEPTPGSWPLFDWQEGPRWWPATLWFVFNVHFVAEQAPLWQDAAA